MTKRHRNQLVSAAMLLAACSAPADDAAHNLHLIRALFEADSPRIIFVGDSFAMARADRVSGAALTMWPCGFNAAVIPWGGAVAGPSSFLAGAEFLGKQQPGHAYEGSPTPTTRKGKHKVAGDDLNFRQGASIPRPLDDWTGIPIGGVAHEWYFNHGLFDPGGPAGDRCGRLIINIASSMAPGVNGRFFRGGDRVKVRPIYWCPLDPREIVDSFDLTPGTGVAGPAWRFFLKGNARGFHAEHAFAGAPGRAPARGSFNSTVDEMRIVGGLDGAPDIGLLRKDPGGDAFMPIAALVVRNESAPGCSIQWLADGSWSYGGHATAYPPSILEPKCFTDATMRRYLDITTIDRDQPWLVVLNIASENRDAKTVELSAAAIIARFNNYAQAIGSPPPHYLLIGQFVHGVPGTADPVTVARVNNQGLLDCARSLPNTAFIGLGEFTQYHALGSSATPQALAWLADHGGKAFPSSLGVRDFTTNAGCSSGKAGDLFDASDVHLAGQPEAEFFASWIWAFIAAAQTPGDPPAMTGVPASVPPRWEPAASAAGTRTTP